MKRTKTEKARLRFENALRLRRKRYKGDHNYLSRATRAGAFRILPYPVLIEPGVPIGLTLRVPSDP